MTKTTLSLETSLSKPRFVKRKRKIILIFHHINNHRIKNIQLKSVKSSLKYWLNMLEAFTAAYLHHLCVLL